MSTINSSEAVLPVKNVTLFASGVAHVLHSGELAAGTASTLFTFRKEQINDVLKSLVLLDSGGTVQTATYPSRDPVSRTLQAFAVNVTDNISVADLLKQVRGANASVVTADNETVTGRIVGVEEREEAIGERFIATSYVSLLADDGLLTLPLAKIIRLRFLEARLDKEFREALSVLAAGSDDSRRTIHLTFAGDTARTVQVGYIIEAPLWKVSYRLVLDANEKPYLQGWALVENTTDEDWSDISLSLVSGLPVSFVQDLYQPVYVKRPFVAADVPDIPFPRIAGASFDSSDTRKEARDFDGATYGAAPAPMMAASASAMGGGGRMVMAKSAMSASAMEESIEEQVEGKSVGELFEYAISQPVSLPRQQAAMIPLLSESLDGGEKVSVYNFDVEERHPLNAFRLKNTSNLHLKGGPITVFDGGAYAGDARMEDIVPSDDRLLTYAVDLAVEVQMERTFHNAKMESATISKRAMWVEYRHTTEIIYTLISKATTDRQVILEYPLYPKYQYTPTPTERTATHARYMMSLAIGEQRRFLLRTDYVAAQMVLIAIDNLDHFEATSVADGARIPDAVRQAVAEVVRQRQAIATLKDNAEEAARKSEQIFKEQERIRANMQSLDQTSPLYRRYVAELDTQETRLAELAAEAERLQTEIQSLERDLNAYIAGLNVE